MHGFRKQRNILHEIRKRKANWIGHILRRNCLLQQVIEGKIKEGIKLTGRWGRRRWKVLDDVEERRGYSHLKEEALDRIMWRARFGRGFGPVVRQTKKWMNGFKKINCLGGRGGANEHVLTCVISGPLLQESFSPWRWEGMLSRNVSKHFVA